MNRTLMNMVEIKVSFLHVSLINFSASDRKNTNRLYHNVIGNIGLNEIHMHTILHDSVSYYLMDMNERKKIILEIRGNEWPDRIQYREKERSMMFQLFELLRLASTLFTVDLILFSFACCLSIIPFDLEWVQKPCLVK